MISFQNVTFSYQENGEPKSLDSINLEVNNGECILLCGKSGCGKTTMTRLLNGMIPNFYEGKLQGTVLLDGQSLFDLPMYEISKQVGSVFQNPRTQFYTVNTTSEIAFGCENLGMESQKIARCIEQTAEDLQIKYLLNRNIFNLSGGEKQRIAIARAILKDAPILLLDESTASLDADNEAKINQALDRLMKGKTVFVIAHRLNTIQNADQIIVLNQGRIEETGTHEELLRKKGHYYEMVQEQQKAREWIVKGA